jgi:hypothetical protein
LINFAGKIKSQPVIGIVGAFKGFEKNCAVPVEHHFHWGCSFVNIKD